MSSRRHVFSPEPRQHFAVYKKIQSYDDDGEEDAAPEFIRVPIEQAQNQAVRPVAPRRRNSAPDRRVEESDVPSVQSARRRRRDSTPARRVQDGRRRGSTPQRRMQAPQTPPSEDDVVASVQSPRRRPALTPSRRVQNDPSPPIRRRGDLSPLEDDQSLSLRTPPPRRSRMTAGRPRGSVTPKLNARRGIYTDESDLEKLFEDGRGSPEERRRKSNLAKTLPRRSDGKFASKNDVQEYQSGGESTDDESVQQSFRGTAKNNKKLPTLDNRRSSGTFMKAAAPRVQRRAPWKVSFDNEASADEGKAVATRSERPINVQLAPKKDDKNQSDSGEGYESGDSFDGITDYHKNVNNTYNVVVISDSTISNQSVKISSDDEE